MRSVLQRLIVQRLIATQLSLHTELSKDEVNAVRRAGGYADLSGTYGFILIKGPQAAQFLQARVSNDVLALASGQGELTALLERKGHIMAFFSLHRLEETFWIVAETGQIALIYSELEKYHFREQVEYEVVSDRYFVFTVQGPLSPKLLSPATDSAASDNGIVGCNFLAVDDIILVRRNLTGENGALILAPSCATEFGEKLRSAAQAGGLSEISRESLNTCRVEAGIPLFGTDLSEEELLPETGLEHTAASYTKGCFQGQEVLARIKTYGAPKRGLMGIKFVQGEHLKFENGATGTINDTSETVIIRSNVFSPTLNCTIALAYVSREFRVPNKEIALRVGESEYRVTVVSLPFYTPSSRSDDAKRFYEKGLAEFAGGSESKAISLLREAIELNPTFADAYEALGVILSRHEQYDEAIALMQKLEALDPESIMAHANLSVFYMQQGNKELAEEEKAKAMSIRMSQVAREFAEKQQSEKDKQQQRQEAENRMGMFKQVLEIDPDDLLANHGMGSAFVELEDYASALPFLRKALEIKPTHTVAYVALGKALEALGDRDGALKTYEDGIAVASKRGDMTPMKEMQERVAAL